MMPLGFSHKNEGPKPKLLNYLPKEGLIGRDIRYFHHSQSLNHHYFVSHENILRLGERTKAVLAPYASFQIKEKTFSLLIQYPTQKSAEEALKNFIKAYMPEASPSQMIRTENDRWTMAQSHRDYLIIVFDAPSQEKADELIRTQFYNRGPHHFDKRFVSNYKGLLIGKDPVALDAVGAKLLQLQRIAYFGEDRPLDTTPKHFFIADQKYKLGVSDLRRIEVLRLGWMEGALI